VLGETASAHQPIKDWRERCVRRASSDLRKLRGSCLGATSAELPLYLADK